MDAIDFQILNILQENSNLTTKELASKVHLSSSPVFERVRRMEKDGIIKKYMAVVDPEKFGNSFMVRCDIKLLQHSRNSSKEFIAAVQEYSEVTECLNISGDYDFSLRIYVRNMKEYQEFVINKLGALHCIGSLHSTFIMGIIKQSNFIPVE